jgi:hypothetical protein
MNWLDGLLDPLLNRLALKLALKVRVQLDGAIDAALDRADDRIDTALERLSERQLAAAAKPIADLKAELGPILDLQRHALEAERLRGDALNPRRAGGVEIKYGIGYLLGAQPARMPDPALQQQLQSAAEMAGTTLAEAANAAGMISAEEGRAQMNAAADAAMAVARDHLRSRLTPPRPWKETPDR